MKNKTITVEIPEQMDKLCNLLGLDPKDIVQGFLCDLSKTVEGTGGSDERNMAEEYFLRRYSHSSKHFDFEEMEEMLCDLDRIRGYWRNDRVGEFETYLKVTLKE